MIGSIGVFRQGNLHRQTAELGYYIAEEYWGRGIMTKAVKQICAYVFEISDMIRIYAEPFAYNTASCRVLEKAGFRYEGTLRSNAMKMANIERIMETEGMIRSRRKIEAVIHNARCFLKVREEFGTFSDYLWEFSKGKTILYMGHQKGGIPAKNGLSDVVSRDLKKRGFKYHGSVTVYAHLQVCGIINDHMEGCFRYRTVMEGYPKVRKRRDKES